MTTLVPFYTRDMPYDYTLLVENVVDPVGWAALAWHHAVPLLCRAVPCRALLGCGGVGWLSLVGFALQATQLSSVLQL